MRKALLVRFLSVVLLALAISSMISYYFIGKKMLDNNISNMLNTIHVVDYALDYEGDIQKELVELHNISSDSPTRISIIGTDGFVHADTETKEVTQLGNHIEREEVKAALKTGQGYSNRYSETLQKNMLYVAGLSHNGKFIIRMALPYTGILDYMLTIFPVMLIGAGIAFVITLILTYRFTDTITKPLQEISTEMARVNGRELNFSFRHYQYEELNIISDTTTKLVEEIGAHLSQLEFEKKIRQEFFSNASHELKTPITSVRGYAELLNQGFAKDEETRKDFFARILKEMDNMTNLINDILMISRLEAKEAEVTFSMVRIAPLVDEIFESLEPIAANYQVSLHLECEPTIIEASVKQLQELITNLVSNGIKYNHAGGDVWVKVATKAQDMVITVKDNGMGISAENKDRIFERFYRVDKGRSKKTGGTGLGLSIVKHIVEYYEGSITVESKVNKGTKFSIYIPMKRGSKRVENKEKSVRMG